MSRLEIMELLGLTDADFEPRDRMGEIEEKQDETKQDVDMLADTVLALCDILEAGEE